jgi:hypothetical protein
VKKSNPNKPPIDINKAAEAMNRHLVPAAMRQTKEQTRQMFIKNKIPLPSFLKEEDGEDVKPTQRTSAQESRKTDGKADSEI